MAAGSPSKKTKTTSPPPAAAGHAAGGAVRGANGSAGPGGERRGFRFAIDRGGTFTDIYAEQPDGSVRLLKLLSVDPAYADAPREGIRRILEQVSRGIE